MAESFENLDNILHDWEKDKNKKKYCRGIEQVREAQSIRKKNDKAVFFLRKWHRKNSPAFRRRARLNQTQNWLVRELLLNKPNKQNVYEIDSFNKFNFSQSQEILDTLIDVRNAKHQNITS